ncbi:GGDEF domain-containing protein [Thiomicrorhabdus sediminis]|uniref:diguanylate cyclase n=1 Tax=Thiomicrorhabdus sediminis TaxID=2580412 RepID=A0A4P9K523_9GAMM|nr:GGDEF domain-containing protein [Thiomicrorhabdus sediminis]QCU89326.1 GGDEF domain-containing protein [Thiomicrorhabdus sediminis]
MVLNIQDAPDKAKRIFSMLIEAFDEQEINPTPLNYYVWYQYFKGDKPQFRQEMDAILDDEFGYNDRVGRRLYDEYLAEDDNPANEFDRAFRRLIESVIKKMNAWSEKLEAQTRDLDNCKSQLSNPDLNAEQVKAITDSVLNTASSMQESSRLFQAEMLSGNEEIRHLRQQLIEARAEAMQDELTEIGNRKAFNESLAALMMSAEDDPQSLCLILSDIDYFKKFNDTFGHLVGDSVLRYYASIIKKSKRDNETISRYGGEEFAILIAESSLAQATERAESIRKAIESAQLKRKNETKSIGTITASFGVTCMQADDDAESFIARADEALYKAKQQGRNRVISAEEKS